MQDIIKSILDNIHQELQVNQKSESLISGSGGASLYQFLYYKHFKNKEFDKKYNNAIQLLVENSAKLSYTPFAGGKSGINWFFSYLFKNGALSQDDWELLCSDDEYLAFTALSYLRNDNYDFLHGGLGIAYQLLYLKGEKFLLFFDQFFRELNQIVIKGGGMFPHYNYEIKGLELTKFNLGLAHGIISILKFCIVCYRKKICTLSAQNLALKIVNFIKENTLKANSHSYFTSILETGLRSEPSRLAWCYGDLTIGYVLLQASLIFKDSQANKLAMNVLHHSAKRRNYEETKIADAGICHGSAGVAHIYNRLWHSTQELAFSEACDFWIEKTLKFSNHKDGIVGYKKFNGITLRFEKELGLLEGVAGIGLVLISYLTKDFSWDYLLMLND